jgi:hypothetical protein
MSSTAVVFRGTVAKSEVLKRHSEMKGRRRYAVTFRVHEYWKGTLGRSVTIYDLDPGTDCLGAGYQTGQEYLVYAGESPAKDYRLDEFFWYG